MILWDASSREPLARGLHDHLVNQCAFSPCGRYLVSASSDYTARIWRIPDMTLCALCAGHEDDVEMAVFSPCSTMVATASRDSCVRVFGIDGTLQKTLRGHKADVLSVAWMEGARFLVTSSDDGTVKRWDSETGEVVEEYDMGGIETDTIALTPSGEIFAGDDEGRITFLNRSRRKSVPAHAAGIKRVAFDSPSRTLLTMSYDRKASFWHVGSDGALIYEKSVELPEVVWPRSCAFLSSDQVVFGTFGTSYAVLNRASGEVAIDGVERTWGYNAVADIEGAVYTIGDAGVLMRNGSVASDLGSLCNFLLPFDRLLITGGQLGRVFDAISGQCFHSHHSPLNCGTVISRNGARFVAVGSYTGEVLIFGQSARGRLVLVETVALHDNAIKGLAYDNGVLFSVCATGAAAFHRVADFQLLRREMRAHLKIANGCVAFGDGIGFASVGRDLMLRLWRDGLQEAVSTPHDHSIKCIAASASLIATGSYNGRVSVYDAALGQWVFNRRVSACGISSLCRSETGFLASSYDGQIHWIAAPAGYIP
ncbi:WD40 repeat domain-containing protein [Sinorhizobium meliloti]|uniref:WD40 repeat domain-containing protein n=1 Tax=Rhizobium meliloti TaxID=382 RepID=UPI003989C394